MKFWKVLITKEFDDILLVKDEDEDGSPAISSTMVVDGVTAKFTFGGYESHEKRDELFEKAGDEMAESIGKTVYSAIKKS